MGKYIGYTRVSTERQDNLIQRQMILDYAHANKVIIDEIIEIEISSRKSLKDRKIELLLSKMDKGDILVVAELSRLGRNMMQTLTIINQIIEKGVKIVFIRQPELSTNLPHSKLLLAIFGYFAEAERDFISMRTVAGLATAKSRGKVLGRPKGQKNANNVLLEHKEFIKKHLKMGMPLTIIHKLIVNEFDKTITYRALRYFVQNEAEFLELEI